MTTSRNVDRIYVKNRHSKSIAVAVQYRLSDAWYSEYWFEVLPKCESLLLEHFISGRTIYYHAHADDGSTFGSGDVRYIEGIPRRFDSVSLAPNGGRITIEIGLDWAAEAFIKARASSVRSIGTDQFASMVATCRGKIEEILILSRASETDPDFLFKRLSTAGARYQALIDAAASNNIDWPSWSPDHMLINQHLAQIEENLEWKRWHRRNLSQSTTPEWVQSVLRYAKVADAFFVSLGAPAIVQSIGAAFLRILGLLTGEDYLRIPQRNNWLLPPGEE